MRALPVCWWSARVILPSERPYDPPAPAALPAMRARFLADFTHGRMGQEHNTFQHRARVLRQLAQARPADA
jgi:hypothetical protein